MSGHSKWANIKRTKEKVDAKRGKIFSKIGREIIVAVRHGGPNPEANIRLKAVVQKARENNMPLDNINRAIARASGGADSANYEEITYEGYGPAGTAIIVEALTDNRNRTASDIRHYFSKYGGNLGETGCVGWMFKEKGLIIVEADQVKDEDAFMMKALEAGAEDVVNQEDAFEVTCAPSEFESLKDGLTAAGYRISHAEVTKLPNTYVRLTGDDAVKMGKMLELLEEHDDVQNVYTNYESDEESEE
ncbi:MAG: YebC/PmpR family DNA-binding transcriptional regulator [Chloroflexota bacterium]